MKINIPKKHFYIKDEGFTLLLGDACSLLKKIPKNSVDMIFAEDRKSVV